MSRRMALIRIKASVTKRVILKWVLTLACVFTVCQLWLFLTKASPGYHIIAVNDSGLHASKKNNLTKEVICSDMQDTCFYIRDIDLIDGFERELRTQKLDAGVLTYVRYSLVDGHTVIDPSLEAAYMKAMLLTAFDLGTFDKLSEVQHAHILQFGLGGGASHIFISHQFPQAKITTIELDPAMKYIATRWFDVKEDASHQIIVQDGIEWMKTNKKQYDLILVDACYSDRTMAPVCPVSGFLEDEAIENLARSVARGGTFVANYVYFTDYTSEQVRQMLARFQKHFKQCYTLKAGGNYALGCTHRELPLMTPDYIDKRRAVLEPKVLELFGDYHFG